MKDYSLSELRKLEEAYRSVYDNPNVRLDDDKTGLKGELAGKIEAFSNASNFPQIVNYADMLFRWLKTDLSAASPDLNFLRKIYIDNFGNVVDYLKDYEYNVKKLKAAKADPAKFGLTVMGSNGKEFFLPYDKLTLSRSRINGVELINRTSRILSNIYFRNGYSFDANDKQNIAFTNRGNGAVVFTTRTFESTNKFIYHLWQNSNFNTVYREPEENSPYCTRVRGHWEDYSHGDQNYLQYWFLKDDGSSSSCPYGNLNDESVMEFFNSLKGRGSQLLICMNDSFGDILDKYDEKPELILGDNLGKYIENPSRELSVTIDEYKDLKSDYAAIGNELEEYKKKLESAFNNFHRKCLEYKGNLYPILVEIDGMTLTAIRNKMSNVRFPKEGNDAEARQYLDKLLDFLDMEITFVYGRSELSSNNKNTAIWNALDMTKRLHQLMGFPMSEYENIENLHSWVDDARYRRKECWSEMKSADSVIRRIMYDYKVNLSKNLKDSPELLSLFELPS